jgi:hypothetical protein
MDANELTERYIHDRKVLETTRSEVFRDYDRTLVTLSTASLGFSVIIAKDICPLAKSKCPVLMVLCWVFFALASVVCLLSMLLSGRDHNREIEILDRRFLDFASIMRKISRSPEAVEKSIREALDRPFAWWYHDPNEGKTSPLSGESKLKKKQCEGDNPWRLLVSLANWVSLGAFLVAVGLFLVYVAVG